MKRSNRVFRMPLVMVAATLGSLLGVRNKFYTLTRGLKKKGGGEREREGGRGRQRLRGRKRT